MRSFNPYRSLSTRGKNLLVRAARRRDVNQIMELDQLTPPFLKPEELLSREDTLHYIQGDEDVGLLVAEYGVHILGVTYFNREGMRAINGVGYLGVDILQVAVYPGCERRGVGTTLLDALKTLLTGRRRMLAMAISEDNIEGAAFLAKNGFRFNDSYDEEDDKGQQVGRTYEFVYLK